MLNFKALVLYRRVTNRFRLFLQTVMWGELTLLEFRVIQVHGHFIMTLLAIEWRGVTGIDKG